MLSIVSLYMKKNSLEMHAMRPKGYTDILYIRRLARFFGVNILNFQIIFLCFFRKNEYFVDIFWGHYKTGLVIGVISMYFGVFSYGKCPEWGYFLRLQKFQGFFGVLDIPDIFWR